MSKMIIYFCLFIPLLFLSTDSSSIRGRNLKNDLVPLLSSRFDAMKRDLNSMKVVSKDPFIIQLHMPNSKEMEARAAKEKDKKRKRPVKKRISKLKPLRKKHRKRRDLFTSKTKPREEKPFRFEIPRAANNTEKQLKNSTRNSVNRMEILKALSYDPKKTETKQNKLEGIRNFKSEGKINTGKTKKNNTSNRNLHKHHLSLSDRSKLAYPSTPKLDRRPQRYTYKDLMADRERLEQKIKYIKNMLNANVTTTDDGARVRRRSDSDRTANKIAKMFLTLSAVNGLHDKRKSKCNDDDYDDDDDRVEDIWEKERRNNPLRKSTSSNEERYKVKKWIEFMKNKRSSGKICPCMRDSYGDESDAFPLEQKLPKGYFLMERGRSSEESSESYRDPYYYSKDKINRNENIKQRLSKSQEQDIKSKPQSKNGKKRLEVPYEDLELYRTRARQILRNAEEILDKIKEEEEKRLAMPNILMSQLKELTARIHGDPRNNENDLIRKIQKNLGWGPLSTPQEETDGTFMDNVKSFILDPYEKAKALTDESTKKLSSYLLRNLGKLQESSKEQPSKTEDGTLKINLGELPDKEEKPPSATLAKEEPRAGDLSKSKEDLQNWEDTLSAILGGGDDTVNKESNWNINQELSPQEVEDTVKEVQKKLNVYKVLDSKEVNTAKDSMKILQLEGNKPESTLEEETGTKTLNEKEDYNKQDITVFHLINRKDEKEIKRDEEPGAILEKKLKDSDNTKKQPFREMEGAFQGKKGESDAQTSRGVLEEKEEERVAMTLNEKENDGNEQDSTGFQLRNGKDEKEIKITEEASLEKRPENSNNTKKQPFREMEGAFQRKKGESDDQASPDVQEKEEEERVAMRLNEKENEDNKQDAIGFHLINGKDEKEIKITEEPKAILEKTIKGSDNIKQPFHEIETLQEKETGSEVQALRDVQEEEEERVAMRLNERVKYENKQDTTEFRSKGENVGQESQEETTKSSELAKKQPFHGIEGTLQKKKEESNVGASQEVQKQEERVAMTINDKGKHDGKLNTEEFGSKEKKGKDSSEEPRVIFQEPKKDSGIIKKQPFRDSEGTFQGEEGESKVQASRDMQEEEKFRKEFEEVVKMLSNNENYNETQKTDEVVQKSNVEEKDMNEDAAHEMLEKQEENEKVPINASSELEKTALREKTPDDSTTHETVGKKNDASFPSITLIDEASPTDSALDSLVKSEEKEIVRADLANEFESNEEPILEKQKELNSKKSEEKVKIKDNKSENFKKSTETQKEEETPISLGELLKESRKKVSLNEEIMQKEIGAKTLPEYADLVQEGEPVSETKQNEEGDFEEESIMRNEEILELNNEKTISKENMKEKNLESISREDSIEDLNTSLRATLDQEHSNLSLDESSSKESDDDVLLKETISDDQKNESFEEDIKEKVLKDSQEILAKGKNKPLLSVEQPHDDSLSSVENNDDSFLKESHPGEAFDNVKEGSETYSRETLNNQDQDAFETQEYQSSEVSDGDFVKDSSGMNFKASIDKDEDLKRDDEVNLKASMNKDEDLERDDEVNLKASMNKDEDLERDDEVNLKASMNKDEDLERDDEVNLKASMDKDEDLDDEVNLKASMDKDEDLDDEVNLKASMNKDKDLDDEVNLKASMNKDEDLERDDEVNLKASMDKDEDLEKDDRVILKASNRYGLDEIQNLEEEKYTVSLRENQENDYQTGSNENVEKVLDAQRHQNKDEKSTDAGTSRENQETDSTERGIETLEKAMDTHEEATVSEKNQNAQNVNLKDHHETIVRAKTPDENVNIKENQESLKSMNNKEMENFKDRESEEIVKETNPEENVQDEKSEILEDKLHEGEYLEAVLKNETQENLEEGPDEEILKAGKADNGSVRSREEPNLEANLEGQDKDFVLKEANFEDLEEKRDDLEDGENVRAVFDNREQYDEISQNLDEDKRQNNEGMNYKKILQKTESLEEELNNQNLNDETLKAVLEEQDQENLEENSENQEAENPDADGEKNDGETPLRSASLEDEFDNKIDYENPLKSAQSLEETDDLESMKYINKDENKDTLRAASAHQDLSNQIDEKNEEAVLKSKQFDPKSPDGNGYSYLTVMEDNVEVKSPLKASNREDANSQENLQERSPLADPQKPDLNSLKASKLKVPKWIGKIMKDLNGKEKTDVTAIQNLNPDKIDDMLGKIGKAEQQNLLEREEVDCRKECACAEEMNTRSRNIGRYEIVKDFLHWVKDLQLNRVLSDE